MHSVMMRSAQCMTEKTTNIELLHHMYQYIQSQPMESMHSNSVLRTEFYLKNLSTNFQLRCESGQAAVVLIAITATITVQIVTVEQLLVFGPLMVELVLLNLLCSFGTQLLLMLLFYCGCHRICLCCCALSFDGTAEQSKRSNYFTTHYQVTQKSTVKGVQRQQQG